MLMHHYSPCWIFLCQISHLAHTLVCVIGSTAYLVSTLFPLACQSGRCRANELFLVREGGLVGNWIACAERVKLALNFSAQMLLACRISSVIRLVEHALDIVGASLCSVLWIICLQEWLSLAFLRWLERVCVDSAIAADVWSTTYPV